MKSKIKCGIWGAGLIADDRMAPAIQKADNSELVAIYARSSEKAAAFALRHNIPRHYSNQAEFLADPDIDAVYISTPNAFHCADTIACARAKKHVLCEKPMATSLDECQQIIEACNEFNVKFAVSFMFPFHPLSVLAKEWVQSGKIGEVRFLQSNFIFNLPEEEKINPWRFNPEISGGGAVIEVGTHCIDILNYLTEAEVISVSAMMDFERFVAPSEKFGTISLKYANDIHGIVTVANQLSGAGSYGTSFSIYGTQGSIIGVGNLNRNPSGTLICRNLEEEKLTRLSDCVDYKLYIDVIEEFSRCVIENKASRADALYGMHNMRIILAAYESAQTGRSIMLS